MVPAKSIVATAFVLGVSASVSAEPVATSQSASILATAERSMHQMAACVARAQRKAAIRILGTDPAAPESNKRLLELFKGCGNMSAVTYSVHNDVLRGAVAEYLYLNGADVPSEPFSPVGSVSASPITIRYAVAACAAARDAGTAAAFVRATRRSAEEADAARKLAPTLNSCAASHVDFSGAELHGALAEALIKMRAHSAQELH